MPELPEVETIVRDVRPHAVGRTIVRAALSHADVLRGMTPRTFLARLRGQRIQSVTRRAKHAVFDLGRDRLVVQPGMTGALLLFRAPLSSAERAYAVLQLTLDDGRMLVYRDVRRLGTLLLLDPTAWERYTAALGPEPLDPVFTPGVFEARLRRTRQAIKKAIMDQRIVAGVGNIYANEALFRAGIDPSRPAADLDPEEIACLRREIVAVLRAAIAAQGTTVRDYRRGTGARGAFQQRLQVYGREGLPCPRCGTPLAGTHAIDARITVFCWRCQRTQ